MITITHHGPSQAIRIMMQVTKGGSFGADVAAAEGVFRVGANPDDTFALDLDSETTHAFAQGAGAAMNLSL
jgi:hypothetical protein